MQPDNPYALTLEDSRAIFTEDIAPTYFNHAAYLKMPELHAVGAQPGSGKSTLIDEITIALKNRFGNDSVVSIIGDELRGFHPNYKRLLEIDASRAAYYTDADSGRWVEQAIALTAQQGNCVIIEGTLRNPEVTIRTASHYLKHGFTAHLHVLAVHEFVSRSRIFNRYFEQVEKSGQGRYTLPKAHDLSYKALPKSVALLTDSLLFKTVTLYDPRLNPICAINLPKKDAGQEVLTKLEKCRDNKYVDTADILLTTDRLLPQAKKHGRIYSDLQNLRKAVSQLSTGSCGNP